MNIEGRGVYRVTTIIVRHLPLSVIKIISGFNTLQFQTSKELLTLYCMWRGALRNPQHFLSVGYVYIE